MITSKLTDGNIKLEFRYNHAMPPWYMRIIGRVYWHGWSVTVTARRSGAQIASYTTTSATEPPTPWLITQACQLGENQIWGVLERRGHARV